jgi:hypothetical protein
MHNNQRPWPRQEWKQEAPTAVGIRLASRPILHRESHGSSGTALAEEMRSLEATTSTVRSSVQARLERNKLHSRADGRLSAVEPSAEQGRTGAAGSKRHESRMERMRGEVCVIAPHAGSGSVLDKVRRHFDSIRWKRFGTCGTVSSDFRRSDGVPPDVHRRKAGTDRRTVVDGPRRREYRKASLRTIVDGMSREARERQVAWRRLSKALW